MENGDNYEYNNHKKRYLEIQLVEKEPYLKGFTLINQVFYYYKR